MKRTDVSLALSRFLVSREGVSVCFCFMFFGFFLQLIKSLIKCIQLLLRSDPPVYGNLDSKYFAFFRIKEKGRKGGKERGNLPTPYLRENRKKNNIKPFLS